MSADTSTYQPAAIPDEGTATQVYRIVIKATPQEIWDAITLPEFTRRYFHGAAITITPDGYASFGPDGSVVGTPPGSQALVPPSRDFIGAALVGGAPTRAGEVRKASPVSFACRCKSPENDFV